MSHSQLGIHDISVFLRTVIMNPEIFEHRFSNGHSVHYRRLPSGTCYHADTPELVVELLEQLRQSRRKIRATRQPVSPGTRNTITSVA
jgi:hypothetical protein